MNIGIPNEALKHENRVSLTPSAVTSLVEQGNSVFLESGAGKSSRFSDEAYGHTGATIVYSKEEIYRRCDLVCGVEPPTGDEIDLMEPGKISMSFLNLPVAQPRFIEKILQNRIYTIGAELIESEGGDRPVIHSMSEIAGQLSVFIAARCLQSGDHGRGIILGGIAGVAPAAVVILGAGVVGTEAARTAVGLGAQVIVLDRDLSRLREVDRILTKRVSTALATPANLKKSAAYADVLIGAVFMKGERAPHIVTEQMVRSMKPGAVIVDVSIDQGGCVETSRPTTIEDPTFIKHDVIHYCVPNITATVARTATYALTNSILPYVMAISQKGMVHAAKEDRSLSKGICTFNGNCTQELITKIFGSKFVPIERLLKV